MAESLDGREFRFRGETGWLPRILVAIPILVLLVMIVPFPGPPSPGPQPVRPADPAANLAISPLVARLSRPECVLVSGYPTECGELRPWPASELPDPTVLDADALRNALVEGLRASSRSDVDFGTETSCSTLGTEALCFSWAGPTTEHTPERPTNMSLVGDSARAGVAEGGLSPAEWTDLWLVWLAVRQADPMDGIRSGRVASALARRRALGLPEIGEADIDRAVERYPELMRKRWNHAREVALDIRVNGVLDPAARAEWEAASERHASDSAAWQVAALAQLRHAEQVRRVRSMVGMGASVLLLFLAALLVRRGRPLTVAVDRHRITVEGRTWAWRDVAGLHVGEGVIELRLRDGGVIRTRPLRRDDQTSGELRDEVRPLLPSESEAQAETEELRRARQQRRDFERG